MRLFHSRRWSVSERCWLQRPPVPQQLQWHALACRAVPGPASLRWQPSWAQLGSPAMLLQMQLWTPSRAAVLPAA